MLEVLSTPHGTLGTVRGEEERERIKQRILSTPHGTLGTLLLVLSKDA